MKNNFPEGVWPVMLTPFKIDGQVDYKALEELVEWYIKGKVSGLFAVCQSSEMFYLSLEERIKITETIVKVAAGRVPVIASGHISDSFEGQVEELNAMSKTGAEAIILITNRLAKEDEDDTVWLNNCKKLVEKIDSDIPLGFYECPYPYKRLLSEENLKWCASVERFFFIKDTCCDIEMIKKRLEIIKGSNLKLYNANTTTLLESLKSGAAGYSGVMANFHPNLYVELCENFKNKEAEAISDALTIASLIERQWYPVNAKYHLSDIEGLSMTTACRVKDAKYLTDTFEQEVHDLDRMLRLGFKKYYR
jgi:Dihydrodipicolinate synthase/N-acetylneuraminate lyase